MRRQNLVPADMPAHQRGRRRHRQRTLRREYRFCSRRARDGYEARKANSEARAGKLRGIGFGYHIKATFGAPEENVELRFEDGTIAFTTGTQAIGQGHETSFPQIISDLLGVAMEDIRYHAGDTDLLPKGGGHGSSRATFMAGTAIHMATEKIKERGRRVAARLLEAAEADIEFADGRFTVTGTDKDIALMDVADAARQAGEPLDTYQEFTREQHTFPNGRCHDLPKSKSIQN